MTFLNPIVLFGLIAAGIPLLIHLFNFRRPRKIDFSSLVFLRELQQTTMQRVRIKQWLLLALRTAAIASLILTFARPTLEGPMAGAIGGDVESAIVIVLDNSMSMTTRDQGGVLLEQAAGFAAELVDLMRPGDQVAVMPVIKTRTGTESAWMKTRNAALDAVSSVEAAFGRADLARVVDEARDLLRETSFINREIYVISDFQSSTLGEPSSASVRDPVQVRLLQVGGSGSTMNTSVEGVEVVSRMIEQGRPARVRAVISAYGEGQPPAVIASVFLNEERAAQATVQPQPESPATVEFAVTPREFGWLRGEVRVEDDEFPADNSRFFSLYVPEEREVLLARGSSFRSSYLELALSSELAPGRTRFNLTTIPPEQLSSVAFTEFDVVLIAGANRFSSGEIELLAGYVQEGGGLLLFSPASEGGNFDELLDAVGGGRLVGLVGGRPDAVAEIESVDLEHPLFEGVFETQSDARELRIEQTEVYTYADYEAADPSELTLARLSSGRPFLQEMRHGAGRVLFMTTLPDPSWSALPVRGLFVPLLFRSLHYLSAGDAVTGGEIILGGTGELRIASGEFDAPVSVSTSGLEFVPQQRSVFGGTLITLGRELTSPGVVDVMAGETLARRVAVNADPQESDLRLFEADEAARALGGDEAGVEVLRGDEGGSSLVTEVQTLRTGVELWNVFMMLALAFLLAEMLVARHWNPEAASG